MGMRFFISFLEARGESCAAVEAAEAEAETEAEAEVEVVGVFAFEVEGLLPIVEDFYYRYHHQLDTQIDSLSTFNFKQ